LAGTRRGGPAGAFFGAAGSARSPGWVGFALVRFGGLAILAVLFALALFAAGDRFDGGVAAVFFVVRPAGWLRRFVGMGGSKVWQWPCH
jgi:hypothetical protein